MSRSAKVLTGTVTTLSTGVLLLTIGVLLTILHWQLASRRYSSAS
jgi:ABC-2 type transport system permease protein